MYQTIKDKAQAALDLQNKDVMDATLREIIAQCDCVLVDGSGQAKEDVSDVEDVKKPAKKVAK